MANTSEQERFARHGRGPAVCFAGAGAGKTTTLLERVRRLVAAGTVPERLLLATFAKPNVADLELRLGDDLAGTQVMTLHKLSFRVVRSAFDMGLCPAFKVLEKPLSLVQTMRLGDMDTSDFLSYMAIEKANLRVPDLSARERFFSKLERAQGRVEQQMLYADFEARRTAAGYLTFDDMGVTAYRLLVAHKALRRALQSSFDHMMVDEFQDVNRAQAELLDVLSNGGKNLVVIGDDDQTIYGWRGANPDYIRSFAKRYRAHTYRLSDNFRCRGEVLALANTLIAQNALREPKSLSLTKGYGGTLSLGPSAALSEDLVADLSLHSPEDMAVLARMYKQFPGIELALMRAGAPYRVKGASPFYMQHACLSLIQQLHGAYYTAYPPETKEERKRAAGCWAYLQKNRLNPPGRINALSRALDEAAAATLLKLAERAKTTERPEVAALLQLAEGLSNRGFIEHMRVVAEQRVGRARLDESAVTLTTAYKAKGLEWDCVYLPGVEEGLYPAPKGELEEERRLFYVAVTRSRETLRLYAGARPSRFLSESQPEARAAESSVLAGTVEPGTDQLERNRSPERRQNRQTSPARAVFERVAQLERRGGAACGAGRQGATKRRASRLRPGAARRRALVQASPGGA